MDTSSENRCRYFRGLKLLKLEGRPPCRPINIGRDRALPSKRINVTGRIPRMQQAFLANMRALRPRNEASRLAKSDLVLRALD